MTVIPKIGQGSISDIEEDVMVIRYHIEKKDVVFFTFTLEVLEGMCYVTALDPKKGLYAVRIQKNFKDQVEGVLAKLHRVMNIKRFS